MSRFGPDPRAFFEKVYREPAPWDIGSAQPALLRLLDSFPPLAPVLDIGCGSGDLTIALAKRGIETVGIDFVATAIEQARAKVLALPPEVQQLIRFEVADALHPAHGSQQIGSVVDSGFLHLFEKDVRDRFAKELALVMPHGGRIYVLAFAVTFPIDNAPLQIDPDELLALFSVERGWRMLACETAEFLNQVATVPATLACFERIIANGE